MKAVRTRREEEEEQDWWQFFEWLVKKTLPQFGNVKQKNGTKTEVKILETKSKRKVQKQLLLIRKFLGMSVSNIDLVKIHNERGDLIHKDHSVPVYSQLE